MSCKNNYRRNRENDSLSGVTNLTSFNLPEKLFLRILKLVAEKEISLVFVTPQKIKELNRIYRGRDEVTDVLSFLYEERDCFGEIFVCPWKVKKEAGNNLFLRELSRTVIHGILHLSGYNHKTKKGEREMKEKEADYFRSVENIFKKHRIKI